MDWGTNFAHIVLGRSNYYYDLEKTKMNHQIQLKKANAKAVKKTVIQQSRSRSKKNFSQKKKED